MRVISPLFLTLSLLTSTLTFAQTPNQAAVDTLTKEVAKAVFANIKQPKAQEIYVQLLACSDGCDPQQVIRNVGSWDQVGAKMQELSELKTTQKFQGMSSGQANAAIRQQLTRFYTTHKAEKPYSVPLSPAVQAQILAKIDGLLPPGEAIAPDSTTSGIAATTQPVSEEETEDNAALAPSAGQRGTSNDKLFWMILAGFVAGLLGGATAVYFLLYKEKKTEADQLRFENSKLSRALDTAQRVKPANVPRQQPQDADQQKARAYDVLLGELGADVDPLEAIRQLKQTPVKTPEQVPPTRSGDPVIDSNDATLESALVQNPSPLPPLPPLEPLLPLNRSEVFYFPPPDPNGQFDMAQKSEILSPESAYRFSVSADDPSVATFRFEADPGRVARFLTYRNYMIEPACESENSYTNAYTRIAMRKDGQAILENGTWRVKTKALIRYE